GTTAVSFGNNVGATQALADLDVTAATINLNAATFNVTAQGGNTATFTGPVVFGTDVTINTDGAADNSVSFTSTVDADAAANNRKLTITGGTGTATFGNNVGASQALAELDVTAATIALNGGSVDVTAQGGNTATFTGAVVLGANVTVNTDGAVDNSVTFASTINADAAANNRALTVTAGTGTATFSGNIGNTQALADFDVTAGSIVFNAASAQALTLLAQLGSNAPLTGPVTLHPDLTVNGRRATFNADTFAGPI